MGAMIDDGDRPRREREQLPLKEQIEAISDIPALEGMLSDIDKRIKHIEVDLEFEVGDEEWDERARGALAAHRICFGHVSRRLSFLKGRIKPSQDSAEAHNAKAAKRLAAAEKQRAMAEASKAAKETKQVELARARLELIDRTTFQGFFMRSAAKLLPEDQYERVMADAQLRHANACRSQITLPRSSEPTVTSTADLKDSK